MAYLVAFGAPASLDGLRRALDAECPDVVVRPAPRSQLRAGFPETDTVVMVATPAEPGRSPSRTARVGTSLISHRHTPTAALRRMVRRVAREFGSARLLVRDSSLGVGATSGVPVRRQTTTLSGFLRSGRVVQDDTLLTILTT